MGVSTKSDPSSSAKTDPTASSAQTDAPAASAKSDGISKLCEDYWAKSRLCNEAAIKSVPDGPAKEQMKKGFEDAEKTTREAWKAFQGKALDEACKTMLESLKSNPNCPKE